MQQTLKKLCFPPLNSDSSSNETYEELKINAVKARLTPLLIENYIQLLTKNKRIKPRTADDFVFMHIEKQQQVPTPSSYTSSSNVNPLHIRNNDTEHQNNSANKNNEITFDGEKAATTIAKYYLQLARETITQWLDIQPIELAIIHTNGLSSTAINENVYDRLTQEWKGVKGQKVCEGKGGVFFHAQEVVQSSGVGKIKIDNARIVKEQINGSKEQNEDYSSSNSSYLSSTGSSVSASSLSPCSDFTSDSDDGLIDKDENPIFLPDEYSAQHDEVYQKIARLWISDTAEKMSSKNAETDPYYFRGHSPSSHVHRINNINKNFYDYSFASSDYPFLFTVDSTQKKTRHDIGNNSISVEKSSQVLSERRGYLPRILVDKKLCREYIKDTSNGQGHLTGTVLSSPYGRGMHSVNERNVDNSGEYENFDFLTLLEPHYDYFCYHIDSCILALEALYNYPTLPMSSFFSVAEDKVKEILKANDDEASCGYSLCSSTHQKVTEESKRLKKQKTEQLSYDQFSAIKKNKAFKRYCCHRRHHEELSFAVDVRLAQLFLAQALACSVPWGRIPTQTENTLSRTKLVRDTYLFRYDSITPGLICKIMSSNDNRAQDVLREMIVSCFENSIPIRHLPVSVGIDDSNHDNRTKVNHVVSGDNSRGHALIATQRCHCNINDTVYIIGCVPDQEYTFEEIRRESHRGWWGVNDLLKWKEISQDKNHYPMGIKNQCERGASNSNTNTNNNNIIINDFSFTSALPSVESLNLLSENALLLGSAALLNTCGHRITNSDLTVKSDRIKLNHALCSSYHDFAPFRYLSSRRDVFKALPDEVTMRDIPSCSSSSASSFLASPTASQENDEDEMRMTIVAVNNDKKKKNVDFSSEKSLEGRSCTTSQKEDVEKENIIDDTPYISQVDIEAYECLYERVIAPSCIVGYAARCSFGDVSSASTTAGSCIGKGLAWRNRWVDVLVEDINATEDALSKFPSENVENALNSSMIMNSPETKELVAMLQCITDTLWDEEWEQSRFGKQKCSPGNIIEFLTASDATAGLVDWLCKRHYEALNLTAGAITNNGKGEGLVTMSPQIAGLSKEESLNGNNNRLLLMSGKKQTQHIKRNKNGVIHYSEYLLISNTLRLSDARKDKYLMQKAIEVYNERLLREGMDHSMQIFSARVSRVQSYREAIEVLCHSPWSNYYERHCIEKSDKKEKFLTTIIKDNEKGVIHENFLFSNSNDSLRSKESFLDDPNFGVFPLVVKPVNGAGSQLVSLVTSTKNLRDSIACCVGALTISKRSAQVIALQEYLGNLNLDRDVMANGINALHASYASVTKKETNTFMDVVNEDVYQKGNKQLISSFPHHGIDKRNDPAILPYMILSALYRDSMFVSYNRCLYYRNGQRNHIPFFLDPMNDNRSMTFSESLSPTSSSSSVGSYSSFPTLSSASLSPIIRRENEEFVVDTVSYNGVTVVTDIWFSRKFPMSVFSNRSKEFPSVPRKNKNAKTSERLQRGSSMNSRSRSKEDGKGMWNEDDFADDFEYAFDPIGKRREFMTTTFVYDYQDLILPRVRSNPEHKISGEKGSLLKPRSTTLVHKVHSYNDEEQRLTDSETTDVALVIAYILRVLEALDMVNGAAHTELMLTFNHTCQNTLYGKIGDGSSGKKGYIVKNMVDGVPCHCTPIPKLIELNPRVQGDIPRATNIISYDQFTLISHILAFRRELWRGRGLPYYGNECFSSAFSHYQDNDVKENKEVKCKEGAFCLEKDAKQRAFEEGGSSEGEGRGDVCKKNKDYSDYTCWPPMGLSPLYGYEDIIAAKLDSSKTIKAKKVNSLLTKKTLDASFACFEHAVLTPLSPIIIHPFSYPPYVPTVAYRNALLFIGQLGTKLPRLEAILEKKSLNYSQALAHHHDHDQHQQVNEEGQLILSSDTNNTTTTPVTVQILKHSLERTEDKVFRLRAKLCHAHILLNNTFLSSILLLRIEQDRGPGGPFLLRSPPETVNRQFKQYQGVLLPSQQTKELHQVHQQAEDEFIDECVEREERHPFLMPCYRHGMLYDPSRILRILLELNKEDKVSYHNNNNSSMKINEDMLNDYYNPNYNSNIYNNNINNFINLSETKAGIKKWDNEDNNGTGEEAMRSENELYAWGPHIASAMIDNTITNVNNMKTSSRHYASMGNFKVNKTLLKASDSQVPFCKQGPLNLFLISSNTEKINKETKGDVKSQRDQQRTAHAEWEGGVTRETPMPVGIVSSRTFTSAAAESKHCGMAEKINLIVETNNGYSNADDISDDFMTNDPACCHVVSYALRKKEDGSGSNIQFEGNFFNYQCMLRVNKAFAELAGVYDGSNGVTHASPLPHFLGKESNDLYRKHSDNINNILSGKIKANEKMSRDYYNPEYNDSNHENIVNDNNDAMLFQSPLRSIFGKYLSLLRHWRQSLQRKQYEEEKERYCASGNKKMKKNIDIEKEKSTLRFTENIFSDTTETKDTTKFTHNIPVKEQQRSPSSDEKDPLFPNEPFIMRVVFLYVNLNNGIIFEPMRRMIRDSLPCFVKFTRGYSVKMGADTSHSSMLRDSEISPYLSHMMNSGSSSDSSFSNSNDEQGDIINKAKDMRRETDLDSGRKWVAKCGENNDDKVSDNAEESERMFSEGDGVFKDEKMHDFAGLKMEKNFSQVDATSKDASLKGRVCSVSSSDRKANRKKNQSPSKLSLNQKVKREVYQHFHELRLKHTKKGDDINPFYSELQRFKSRITYQSKVANSTKAKEVSGEALPDFSFCSGGTNPLLSLKRDYYNHVYRDIFMRMDEKSKTKKIGEIIKAKKEAGGGVQNLEQKHEEKMSDLSNSAPSESSEYRCNKMDFIKPSVPSSSFLFSALINKRRHPHNEHHHIRRHHHYCTHPPRPLTSSQPSSMSSPTTTHDCYGYVPLTSVKKTVDIFRCPAAVVLFGPRCLVDSSCEMIRYLEDAYTGRIERFSLNNNDLGSVIRDEKEIEKNAKGSSTGGPSAFEGADEKRELLGTVEDYCVKKHSDNNVVTGGNQECFISPLETINLSDSLFRFMAYHHNFMTMFVLDGVFAMLFSSDSVSRHNVHKNSNVFNNNNNNNNQIEKNNASPTAIKASTLSANNDKQEQRADNTLNLFRIDGLLLELALSGDIIIGEKKENQRGGISALTDYKKNDEDYDDNLSQRRRYTTGDFVFKKEWEIQGEAERQCADDDDSGNDSHLSFSSSSSRRWLESALNEARGGGRRGFTIVKNKFDGLMFNMFSRGNSEIFADLNPQTYGSHEDTQQKSDVSLLFEDSVQNKNDIVSDTFICPSQASSSVKATDLNSDEENPDLCKTSSNDVHIHTIPCPLIDTCLFPSNFSFHHDYVQVYFLFALTALLNAAKACSLFRLIYTETVLPQLLPVFILVTQAVKSVSRMVDILGERGDVIEKVHLMRAKTICSTIHLTNTIRSIVRRGADENIDKNKVFLSSLAGYIAVDNKINVISITDRQETEPQESLDIFSPLYSVTQPGKSLNHFIAGGGLRNKGLCSRSVFFNQSSFGYGELGNFSSSSSPSTFLSPGLRLSEIRKQKILHWQRIRRSPLFFSAEKFEELLIEWQFFFQQRQQQSIQLRHQQQQPHAVGTATTDRLGYSSFFSSAALLSLPAGGDFPLPQETREPIRNISTYPTDALLRYNSEKCKQIAHLLKEVKSDIIKIVTNSPHDLWSEYSDEYICVEYIFNFANNNFNFSTVFNSSLDYANLPNLVNSTANRREDILLAIINRKGNRDSQQYPHQKSTTPIVLGERSKNVAGFIASAAVTIGVSINTIKGDILNKFQCYYQRLDKLAGSMMEREKWAWSLVYQLCRNHNVFGSPDVNLGKKISDVMLKTRVILQSLSKHSHQAQQQERNTIFRAGKGVPRYGNASVVMALATKTCYDLRTLLSNLGVAITFDNVVVNAPTTSAIIAEQCIDDKSSAGSSKSGDFFGGGLYKISLNAETQFASLFHEYSDMSEKYYSSLQNSVLSISCIQELCEKISQRFTTMTKIPGRSASSGIVSFLSSTRNMEKFTSFNTIVNDDNKNDLFDLLLLKLSFLSAQVSQVQMCMNKISRLTKLVQYVSSCAVLVASELLRKLYAALFNVAFMETTMPFLYSHQENKKSGIGSSNDERIVESVSCKMSSSLKPRQQKRNFSRSIERDTDGTLTESSISEFFTEVLANSISECHQGEDNQNSTEYVYINSCMKSILLCLMAFATHNMLSPVYISDTTLKLLKKNLGTLLIFTPSPIA